MPPFAATEIDRRLPLGDEIFLDHVGHFVPDVEAASRALAHAGFAPTPISIQTTPDSISGVRPTGTGNVTAMLERGYLEVLFKTADTALGREFDTALARYPGLHLAAFAVADAVKARSRLLAVNFRMRPLVEMKRPVGTATGTGTAAFTIARVEPDVMPEGRIQMLTHHTEHTVWQSRWLAHPNTAIGLIDVVIAVANVEEAALRFARFTGRNATPASFGRIVRLDRGGVVLMNTAAFTAMLPELAISSLPYIGAYGVAVQSLAAVESVLRGSRLSARRIQDGLVVGFPPELGRGAWLFVERAEALPWRSRTTSP
jgi:hypothetical protein